MRLVRVCRCNSEVEAGSMISLLRSNRFNPVDLRRSPSVEIAGAELDYYVEVPENEAAQAVLMLKDLEITGVIG